MPPKKVICDKCSKEFVMGVTGSIDGCDKCTGDAHDKYGLRWEHWETQKEIIVPSTAQHIIISREKAFSE